MKTIQLLILIFLFMSTFLLPNTYAQDYAQWDLPEGAKLRIGKGGVENLTFSSDGNRLIVESSIGIWVYDIHTGVELDLIAENQSNILGVSPDTSMYVSRETDNTVQLRDLADGSIRTTLKGNTEDIHRIAFSSDGRMLAGAIDGTIHLWDLATGEQNAILDGHTKWIWSMAFSPDGTTLASGSSDNTLRLWDVATGSHKVTLSKNTRIIDDLVFSPDGSTLLSGDTNNVIQVWDVNTGQKKNTFKPSSSLCMKFSPNGETIVTGTSQGFALWDVATGTLKTEFGGHVRGVGSIAFSPDGKTLASGARDELFLWNFESGKRVMSIPGHTNPVAGMAFNPNGNILATSSGANIHLWNPTTSEHKERFFGGHWQFNSDLVFSPDGNILASLGGLSLFMWDVSSAINIADLRKSYGSGQGSTSTARYNTIAFSPDGKFLAAGNNDKTIHLYYLGRTFLDALIGHTESVTTIAFSQDNRLLVSGSDDQTVRLWDFTSRSNIATFIGHTDKVYTVAFNPNASIVASGSQDNTIMLWDVATGESRVIHTGHTEGVRNLKFSIDGRTLVSSGGDWHDPDLIVKIWDVATGEQKAALTGHTHSISDIVFSPDGTTLASGSWDGTVLFWDYTTLLDTEDKIQQIAEDVNRDGSVDLQDLIFVASQFGQTGDDNAADVNADGVINIADILLVAAALGNGNGAPSRHSQSIDLLTAGDLQQWLNQSQQVNSNIPSFQRGIAKLEQLLALLTPEKNLLLPNYPNPFNPETWIPYQLANPADVQVHIHSADGQLVRTLVLGNQSAGLYQSRSRAAHWDGKNEFGEPVASGIYFYTLSAGKFTATRRMVIRK